MQRLSRESWRIERSGGAVIWASGFMEKLHRRLEDGEGKAGGALKKPGFCARGKGRKAGQEGGEYSLLATLPGGVGGENWCRGGGWVLGSNVLHQKRKRSAAVNPGRILKRGKGNRKQQSVGAGENVDLKGRGTWMSSWPSA